MAPSASNTVVGVFESPQQAQRAVMDLKTAGFTEHQIGVLSRDQDGKVVGKPLDDDTQAAEGAVAGATAGAGLGALWGLGILAGVLPGLGPAIAGGTLGVLLSSAAAGAAAIGIAGALVGLGVPEEEATYYETEFKSGRTIVTVRAAGESALAERVMQQQGGQTNPRHPASV